MTSVGQQTTSMRQQHPKRHGIAAAARILAPRKPGSPSFPRCDVVLPPWPIVPAAGTPSTQATPGLFLPVFAVCNAVEAANLCPHTVAICERLALLFACCQDYCSRTSRRQSQLPVAFFCFASPILRREPSHGGGVSTPCLPLVIPVTCDEYSQLFSRRCHRRR